MHTTARDVSKQRQREVELRQHEAYLESASDVICLVDQDGIIHYDSPRITEVLGYGFNDRLGKSGFEYIHPDDRDRIKKGFHENVIGSATTELYEYRAKTKDDGWVWVESSARNLTDDPDVGGIVVSIRDITKRKEEQQQRETLIDNLPGIAYRCQNEEGWPMDTVEGNSKELTGYAQSAFESSEVLWGKDMIHPNDHDEVWETVQTSLQQNDAFQTTYRIITPDGDQRWMWERGKHVLTVSENDPVIEGFITDVTEREQLKRKQQQIINRVTDGIIELDADWQFTFFSGQGGELAGVSEDDVLGRGFWKVFDNIQGTTFEKQYREVMETREMASFVEYHQGVDSWFDVQAYPNDNGGIDIYFRDVTERKESEQALQQAEKQYQTLLELAPLPIIVINNTTSEIIEANEAAEDMLGYRTDEIVGHSKEILRPEGQPEAYDETFRRAVQEESTFRTLSDGSPYQITANDGERIPVEISVRTVTLDGTDVAYGILRDITDEHQYQRRLAALNDVTRELFDAETQRDVKQQAVETLADTLDVLTVSFYSFEEEKWELLPEISKTATESFEPPVLDPGDGVEWQALTEDQTVVIDDFEPRKTASDSERKIRSKVAIPVADHGVLMAGDPQPDVFSEWTVSLAETLSATVATALERTEREQHLKTQRKELQEVEAINERIRGITQEIVQTETRASLEESVCEQLITSNLIDFAWIGRVDLETDIVTPQAQAGLGGTYLSDVSLSLDGETDPEPSVAALQSREACHHSNTAADIQRSDWRGVAVEQGFQSVLSIPIKHEDALYGGLNVYTQTSSGYPDILQSQSITLRSSLSPIVEAKSV
ncbi:PAS domain S-box protein, partial [Halonotius pteroides]